MPKTPLLQKLKAALIRGSHTPKQLEDAYDALVGLLDLDLLVERIDALEEKLEALYDHVEQAAGVTARALRSASEDIAEDVADLEPEEASRGNGQCAAVLARGGRCSRPAAPGSEYCNHPAHRDS